jgi:uncharacterized protein (TIGR03067 family)
MTRFAVALVLMSGAVVGLTRAADNAPKVLDGTYKLISAERDGKLAPQGVIDAMTVEFKGDEFVVSTGPDDKKVAKVKVTADAKPPTIDFLPADGEYKGKTLPGIFKLDKGELTIAYTEKGGDRPKEFKSENDTVLLKLKKVEKDK